MKWTRQFTDGDDQAKTEVLIDALSRGSTKISHRIYMRAGDSRNRQSLLFSVISPSGVAINQQHVPYLLAVESLIQREPKPNVRREALERLLQRSGWYLARGIGKDRLIRRIKNSDDPFVRRVCLKAFLNTLHDDQYIKGLIDDGSMETLITATMRDTEGDDRNNMLRAFSQVGWAIRRAKDHPGIYNKLIHRMSPEACEAILPSWTKQAETHAVILANSPPEQLAEVYQSIQTPAVRDRLLARLYALQKWRELPGKSEWIIHFLSDAQTDVEKRARISGTLETWSTQPVEQDKNRDEVAVNVIKEHIRSVDQVWQVEPLVLASAFTLQFGDVVDAESTAKLYELVKKSDDATIKSFFAKLPVSPLLAKAFDEHRLSIDLCRWVQENHSDIWAQHGSQFFSSTTLFQSITDDDVPGVLELIQDATKKTLLSRTQRCAKSYVINETVRSRSL